MHYSRAIQQQYVRVVNLKGALNLSLPSQKKSATKVRILNNFPLSWANFSFHKNFTLNISKVDIDKLITTSLISYFQMSLLCVYIYIIY